MIVVLFTTIKCGLIVTTTQSGTNTSKLYYSQYNIRIYYIKSYPDSAEYCRQKCTDFYGREPRSSSLPQICQDKSENLSHLLPQAMMPHTKHHLNG